MNFNDQGSLIIGPNQRQSDPPSKIVSAKPSVRNSIQNQVEKIQTQDKPQPTQNPNMDKEEVLESISLSNTTSPGKKDVPQDFQNQLNYSKFIQS